MLGCLSCQPTLFALTQIHFIRAALSTLLAADIVPRQRHGSSHTTAQRLHWEYSRKAGPLWVTALRDSPISSSDSQTGRAGCGSVSSSHPVLHTAKHQTAPRAPILSSLATAILFPVAWLAKALPFLLLSLLREYLVNEASRV